MTQVNPLRFNLNWGHFRFSFRLVAFVLLGSQSQIQRHFLSTPLTVCAIWKFHRFQNYVVQIDEKAPTDLLTIYLLCYMQVFKNLLNVC